MCLDLGDNGLIKNTRSNYHVTYNLQCVVDITSLGKTKDMSGLHNRNNGLKKKLSHFGTANLTFWTDFCTELVFSLYNYITTSTTDFWMLLSLQILLRGQRVGKNIVISVLQMCLL